MSVAGFPRTARILSKPEFDLAFRAGLSAGSKLFRGLVVADAAPRLGITVPKRGQLIRVMYSEIGRILSHLLNLTTQALDVGALTGQYHFRAGAAGQTNRRCRRQAG